MQVKFKLSGENLDLSRFEVETIFGKTGTKRGKFLTLDKRITRESALKLIEKSALIKKVYFPDGSTWTPQHSQYRGRHPKDRPAFHPTGMKPKMARVMVNLSGAKSEIMDPFCGTGAILIEAAVNGLSVRGSDYDDRMIKRSKINLKHYKIKPKSLIKLNALELSSKFKKNSVEAIISDPPYGQSSTTSNRNIRQLFKEFIEESYKLLKKNGRLIIIVPSKISMNRLIYPKFKKLGQFDWYVHGGLTRRFVVLEK